MRDSQNRKSVIFAVALAISIFSQIVFFHYRAFHSFLFSSIVSNPVSFLAFYLPKLTVAILICSFVFLSKNRLWTVILSFLIDVWIFAELIYFRANAVFLDPFAITMAGNMKGFWDSIKVLVYAGDWLVLIPTVLLLLIVVFTKAERKRSLLLFIITLSIGLALHMCTRAVMERQYHSWGEDGRKVQIFINPFKDYGAIAFYGASEVYIRETSVVHSFIFDFIQLCELPFKSNSYTFDESDTFMVSSIVGSQPVPVTPEGNLIVILFESLENWAVTPLVTPNIYRFLEGNENCFWATKIKKQTKAGTSADGQMIINTGLLPINEGAVCFRYPNNVFPSLSEIYDKSAIIVPGDLTIWNQGMMNNAYGIDSAFVIHSEADLLTFDTLCDIHDDYQFVMAITMASHTPFNDFAEESSLALNAEMPVEMSNYLKCVNYTDACLGPFLEKISTDPQLQNTTVVITGDHTIFDINARARFDDYCKKSGDCYQVRDAFSPLIIYSPNINSPTVYGVESYQMDVYPTVLHLIGCSDYYWKGFGINLLDDESVRIFDEEDAFDLSDKLIRSNYFEKVTR